MKKKASVVVLLCCLGLTTLFIGNVDAAGGWFSCTVSLAGATTQGFFLELTDTAATPAFTKTSFAMNMSNPYSPGMLAAALTAASSGGKLWVGLTDTTSMSLIIGAFVQQ